MGHGLNTRNSRIYRIWNNMKRRCQGRDPHSKAVYSDKGITVCEDWLTFIPFYKWATSNGYRDDLSLDRIDASKGYSPANCRWATIEEQHKHLAERKSKYGRNISKHKNHYSVRCYENGQYFDKNGFKTIDEAVAYRDEWRALHGYY